MSGHQAWTAQRSRCVLFICVFLLHSSTGRTTPLFEACPRQIDESEIKLISGPVGWQAYNPNPLLLRAAGFMGGAPPSKIDLTPDSSEKHGQGLVSTWTFERSVAANAGGLWLTCAYGNRGELTLSRKISPSIVECSVIYADMRDGADRKVRVTCR